MTKQILSILMVCLGIAPHVTAAADVDVEKTFLWIYRIFDFVTQIVLVVAVVLLFWGLGRLLSAKDDQEVRQLAYSHIFNSTIAMVATICIWLFFTAIIKYFDFEILESFLDIFLRNVS